MFSFPLGSVSGFSPRICPIFHASLEPCTDLKGGISNSVMLKRDPQAPLDMNNPCVFRVVSDNRRLCLNVCTIKQLDGEIKGSLTLCPNVKAQVDGN